MAGAGRKKGQGPQWDRHPSPSSSTLVESRSRGTRKRMIPSAESFHTSFLTHHFICPPNLGSSLTSPFFLLLLSPSLLSLIPLDSHPSLPFFRFSRPFEECHTFALAPRSLRDPTLYLQSMWDATRACPYVRACVCALNLVLVKIVHTCVWVDWGYFYWGMFSTAYMLYWFILHCMVYNPPVCKVTHKPFKLTNSGGGGSVKRYFLSC